MADIIHVRFIECVLTAPRTWSWTNAGSKRASSQIRMVFTGLIAVVQWICSGAWWNAWCAATRTHLWHIWTASAGDFLETGTRTKALANDAFECEAKVFRKQRINHWIHRRITYDLNLVRNERKRKWEFICQKCHLTIARILFLGEISQFYLQYPSQKNNENSSGWMQLSQNARTKYMVKNGSQHTMNRPTMIANVFAAFVSMRKRFTCALMFRLPIFLLVRGDKPFSKFGKLFTTCK